MPKPTQQDTGWKQLVIDTTGCSNPQKLETIQSLWSGFGSIFRVTAGTSKLVVKHVNPAGKSDHPRGWQSDFATQRKLRSYEVENCWYQNYSSLCHEGCRIPAYLGSNQIQHESWLLLEDLDAAGFNLRFGSLDMQRATSCLDWLANFHALFMNSATENLWPIGTYWHLATRPDEFNSMTDGALKQYAHRIDQILNQCQYQSLVHGDAKVANFCFGHNNDVAAVDFQYIGGGCGMKDVAYFIGSCFSEDECSEYAGELLDRYFSTLTSSLKHLDESEARRLQKEWRAMYPLAWTDYYRFLSGWMPTHKKIHRYTKRLAEQAFDTLPDFSID